MAKHDHTWDMHGDQYDVGNNGVRMFCKECNKVLVFPREKVEQMNPTPNTMSSTDNDELRDSEVLRILKRRVYHGARHDTKLEDLKKASKEILDWVDSTIAKDQLYEQLIGEAMHYQRTCQWCGYTWLGLHCPHDGHQNNCPQCDEKPTLAPNDEGQCTCELAVFSPDINAIFGKGEQK